MYKYSAIPLGKGLNFVTGKSILEAGTLVDCLNYEIVDTGGLRRVDGILKWDGAQDIQSEVLWELPITLTTAPAVGSYLYSSEAENITICYDPAEPDGIAVRPFGIYIGTNGTVTYFAMLDASRLPYGEDKYVYAADAGATVLGEPLDTAPYIARPATAASANILDIWNTFLSQYSGTKNGPFVLGPCNPARVLGLHFFNKNAYAIVDCIHELQFTRISSRVVPGDYITNSAGTASALVLFATLESGSWTGGTDTDVATLVISPLERTSPTGTTKRYGSGTFNEATFTNLRYFAKNGVRFTGVGSTGTLEPSLATFDKRADLNTSSIWKSYSEIGAAELGGIQSVEVTSGGSGYDTAPAVSFSAPPTGGVAPIAYAVMTGTTPNLSVSKVVIVDPGRGYNSSATNPTVTFTGGAPTAAATATCTRTNWQYSGLHPNHNGWVVKVNSNGNLWPSGYLNKVNKGKIVGNQPAGAVPGNTSFGVPSRILTGLDFDTAVQAGPYGGWSPVGATTYTNSLVSAADTSGVAAPLRDVWSNYDMRTATIGFTGFTELSNSTTGGGPIPEDAIIRGVEVKVTYDTTTAFSVASITTLQMRATLFKTSNSALENENQRTETRLGNYLDQDLTAGWAINVAATDEEVTFGGASDLWGATLKYTDLWDPNFGVALDVYVNRASTTGTTYDLNFRIDKVELKVYYYSPSSFLYFGDADGNKIKAYLLDYYVTEGSLESGTAEMYLQVSKLQQVATSTTANNVKYHIGPTRPNNTTSTMSVYVDEALTSSGKVGDVAEDMSYNGLPNYDAMRAADSKCKMLDGNFYANEDWAAVYGVTGAGRAFSHDGLFFTSIWAYKPGDTSGDISDKPRHIAIYKDRLVLGYRAGNVSMSAVGEANNFSGILGAVDIGTGAQVTGLQVFQGNYLAVFCDSKILGITSNFDVTTLSPNSGAIEYTVEAIGNTPVYCNSQGIFTLAQSDKYGDFAGMSLSAAVYPWLRPRLSKSSASISGTSPGGIVQAYVCRSKNQYRLWFADGYQLVMWYTGEPELAPEFTLMRYSMASYVNSGGPNYYINLTNQVAPLCVSSSVDDDGREIMLFYPDYFRYSRDCLPSLVASSGIPPTFPPTQTHYEDADDFGFYNNSIYKIDSFWIMDLVGSSILMPIQAFVQFNYWNKENPFIDATVRKCRLEGTSRNAASLSITTDINYNNPDPDVDDRVDVSLDDTTSTGIPADYVPRSAMANLAESGRLISIRIDNFDSNNYLPKYTDSDSSATYGPALEDTAEPSHYLQALLLQFEEGKEDG